MEETTDLLGVTPSHNNRGLTLGQLQLVNCDHEGLE